MRNLEILPEDILVVAEFRISELKMLREAMNNTTVAMNLSDPEQQKAHDFFTQDFMNWINGTIRTCENG